MFRGYIYTIFLAALLEESVEDLVLKDTIDSPSLCEEVLTQIVADEVTDSEVYSQSFPQRNEQTLGNITESLWPLLLRGNAICHSMRQPSQARCDGLVDGYEATQKGRLGYCANKDHYRLDSLPDGEFKVVSVHVQQKNVEFNVGASVHGLEKTATRPPWMVASDTWYRHVCGNSSNIVVNQDYADSFIVRHEDGWMRDHYPNNATLQVYSMEPERKGVILICFKVYPFLKVPVSQTFFVFRYLFL